MIEVERVESAKIKKDNELFVRVPLHNIKLEDPYEQSKLDEMKLINPDRAISQLEEVFKDVMLTVSFCS